MTLFRFVSVYSLSYLLNRSRIEPIRKVDQLIMAYGGLRGGIAFSLTKVTSKELVPNIETMLCSCFIVIFFTSFIQGATIHPIVQWLHVKCEENDDRKIRRIHEEIMNRVMDHLTTGIEDIIGYHGRHWWIHKIHEINAKHINPILMHDAWVTADQGCLSYV